MSNFLIDEDTDLLAAEFVLGTLDAEERANAQSLLRMDHGFIAMVRIWERRFGELHLMVEPVEPNAQILQRIKAKIAEIAPSGPIPDGKLPVEMSPQVPDATGSPARTETPKPGDAPADAAMPKPPDAPVAVPADGTAPKPPDVPASGISATGVAAKAPELPPAPGLVIPDPVVAGPVVPGPVVPTEAEIPTTAEAQGIAEVKPAEAAVRSERGPNDKVAIPSPPSLPPSPLKLPDRPADKFQDRAGRRPEITIDVIRSRGRWRTFGVCMTVMVMGLMALLAAWRFVPDRLPARLRPAELMTFIGIQALPPATPTVKPARPEAQFDE
jgi:hypothetical protein